MSYEAPRAAEQEVGETQQRLLHVAAAQIKAAVRETDQEVEALAQAMRAIAMHADRANGKIAETVEYPTAFNGSTDPKDIANECVILLQFHDRMSQRLEHAANMVRLLADNFHNDSSHEYELASVSKWEKITEQLRQCYTSERERRLFDAILHNGPESSAVDEVASYSQDVAKSDRIELF